MRVLLWIGCGGALGAVLRYAVSVGCQRLAGGVFPVGTLTVNVGGCLLIGFLGALLSGPFLLRDELRLGLLVGVLGGFTTFSTFGWETFALLNDGEWSRAALNMVASNVLGLAALWLGYRLAEQLGGAS
jgi:CrcB protein